jgi:arylsulfatase A-like enzyme
MFNRRELLKAAAAAHFGKWHLGSGSGAPGPEACGFEDHRSVNGNGPSREQRDRAIRRLPARLNELGLAAHTLAEDIHIRNASHSGAGSSGPFRGRKRSLYEDGIRLPCLVRRPGRVPAGRVDDASVLTAVGFLPTLASRVGLYSSPRHLSEAALAWQNEMLCRN